MIWLLQHYIEIRLVHITCVALSGTLFTARGIVSFVNQGLANLRSLRLASYMIDTTLLAAAILLTLVLHQYPGTDAWLTTKVLLLVLYIALGIVALRRGRTLVMRAVAFLAALVVFGYIIGVAIAHNPAGWLLYLGR